MKTEIINVHPEYPDLEKISYCAKIIHRGGLVIFPTETVYGIAANVSNANAIRRLREIKKRQEGKPFSVLISQKDLISNYTASTDTALYKLVDVYWPGPLTVVVEGKEKGMTIGIRMPDNIIALRLVQESQCTIAAPSANFEGGIPPLTCQDALKDFDGLVDAAIDGGTSRIGRASSVIDLAKGKPALLREGEISQEDIDKVVQKKVVLFVCTGNSCRSVMAEYLLKKELCARDDVEISSAGTGVFIYSSASTETITVLGEEGIDASGHLSRPVNGISLKKADIILVMTKSHRAQILAYVPEVENRVYLLREFVSPPGGSLSELDIPDPMGHTHAQYKECLEIIKEAVGKIKELI